MVTQSYNDIRDLTDKEPIWYDEFRVPRYTEFHPHDMNNIYASEAALIEVACQECGRKFLVAESAYEMDTYDEALKAVILRKIYSQPSVPVVSIQLQEFSKEVTIEAEQRKLSNLLKEKAHITGGDPPFHGYWNPPTGDEAPRAKRERELGYPPCSAGYSMTVTPIRVVQFWSREKYEWVRISDLEEISWSEDE